MIKASELRLGNIVGFVMSKNLCYVSSIGEDGFITTTGISNNKGEYNAERGEEDMMPIVLTPEILEKAGFEKNYDDFLKMDDNFIIDSEGYVYLERQDNITHIITVVRYVHQLQNLYFALTGKELAIKL